MMFLMLPADIRFVLIKEISPLVLIIYPLVTVIYSALLFLRYDNMTERKRLLSEITREKQLLEITLLSVGDGVITTDGAGKITLINAVAETLTGWKQDEAIGISIDKVFNICNEYTKITSDNIVQEVINSGVIHELANHTVLKSKKGFERSIEDSAAPIIDINGEIIGVVLVFRDLTEKQQKRDEIELLMNTTLEGIYGVDLEETCTFVNRSCLEILGYESKYEILGKNMHDQIHHSYEDGTPFPREKCHISSAIYKGKNIRSEGILWRKDGKSVPVAISSTPKVKLGRTVGAVCTFKDITESKQAQAALITSEKRYRELIGNLEAGVVVHAADSSIIMNNKRASELLRLTDEQLQGKVAIDPVWKFIDEDLSPIALKNYPVNLLINEKKPIKEYIVGVDIPKTDDIVWLSVNGIPNLDKNGDVIEVIISFIDISAIKNKGFELEYAANNDFLTGLYNRRYFVEKFSKMDNPKYYPLGVMMIDVNGLKIINDAYGYDAGDITLKKAARILKESMRKQDVITRIGGDEFAVILPNIDIDEIEMMKKAINKKSGKETINNLVISLATGYEIKTEDTKANLDEMLRLAENHMYRHKLSEGASVRNNAIKAILKTLTDKFDKERIHSVKVSQLCKKIGEALELNEGALKGLELAGMYHDIGKISIPDAILNKPGRLTEEEFDIMKTHPEVSYQILRAADEYSDLAIHALYHHERWDGKGYPSGKQGEDIPLFSRIITVADAYEAMTSVRVYKDKMNQKDAVNEIIRCSGTQFDKAIAKVFVTKVLHKEWK